MSANGSGCRLKYLHIVSVFPALTETFILREARKMRETGCEVVIGQLRPAGSGPTSRDFEDLRSCVVRLKVYSPSILAAVLYFVFTGPRNTWTYAKLVLGSFPDLVNLAKLAYLLLASMALAYQLRGARIVHVHGHHLHSEAVSAMFTAGFLGIPYSFKGYTVKTYYPRRVLLAVCQNAAFIIADTFQVRGFLDSLHANLQKVHVLRNSLNLSDFPMRLREPPSDRPTILAVGRLDYKKGFHVLLAACAILRDQGVAFRCVVVGNGDEREHLAALRRELKLEEQVEMVGSLGFPDVQRWYERATILAMPSVVGPDGSTDGLPTVVIEAFARGVPVVGSTTAGIPEVIRDGENGFVVPASAPRELAERLKELLSSPELRRKFATGARRTAEREFDLDRSVPVISSLMQGKTAERVGPLGAAGHISTVLEHTT